MVSSTDGTSFTESTLASPTSDDLCASGTAEAEETTCIVNPVERKAIRFDSDEETWTGRSTRVLRRSRP